MDILPDDPNVEIYPAEMVQTIEYTIKYYEYMKCEIEAQLCELEDFIDGKTPDLGLLNQQNPILKDSREVLLSSTIIFGSIAIYMRQLANKKIIIQQYVDVLLELYNVCCSIGFIHGTLEPGSCCEAMIKNMEPYGERNRMKNWRTRATSRQHKWRFQNIDPISDPDFSKDVCYECSRTDPFSIGWSDSLEFYQEVMIR
jgi:hypothetical protein